MQEWASSNNCWYLAFFFGFLEGSRWNPIGSTKKHLPGFASIVLFPVSYPSCLRFVESTPIHPEEEALVHATTHSDVFLFLLVRNSFAPASSCTTRRH